jgi:P-type Cu2+ transporter
VADVGTNADPTWLTDLESKLSSQPGKVVEIDLDVQGLRCAACVWLFEQLYARQPGGLSVLVNPGAGKLHLQALGGTFSLRSYIKILKQFGYIVGQSRKPDSDPAMRDLLIRVGVCSALALNNMLFALSIYFGLVEGPIHQLMSWASWGAALLSVLVGGTPFFRSAWHALRLRVLHLDVPIALGILLSFLGSSYAQFWGSHQNSYFDTVSTFVALMLIGRLLQQRILDRNRRSLLADDGIEEEEIHQQLPTGIETIRFAQIKSGMNLLLLPGSVVPVDATLIGPALSVSAQWITGESNEKRIELKDKVHAGEIHVGQRTSVIQAEQDFADSRLRHLLSSTTKAGKPSAEHLTWWTKITQYYVVGVLFLALVGGAAWWLAGAGWEQALNVSIAVLVVTCPCAIGIATPLAYELVQSQLRKQGIYIKSKDLLDRLPNIRHVLFDKTGTLTLGTLTVRNPEVLNALPEKQQVILWNMAKRSHHPKSRAISTYLSLPNTAWVADWDVTEHPGKGLELRLGQHTWRLGSQSFVGASANLEGDMFFGQVGREPIALGTQETIHPNTAQDLHVLQEQGWTIHMLSGDSEQRVTELAKQLCLDMQNVRSGLLPEQKREYIQGIDDQNTLMLGDGVNDTGAIEQAYCSGTPAINLPFLPARTDFYVQGSLVTSVRALLASAQRVSQVSRQNVVLALAYNLLAIGFAYAGMMSPLLCAVVMPLSSVSVITWTLFQLHQPTKLSFCSVPPSPLDKKNQGENSWKSAYC